MKVFIVIFTAIYSSIPESQKILDSVNIDWKTCHLNIFSERIEYTKYTKETEEGSRPRLEGAREMWDENFDEVWWSEWFKTIQCISFST